MSRSDKQMARSNSIPEAESRRAVERALAAFQAGEPVCIHDADDREGETDLVYPAGSVTPKALSRLRNDAGGLVCVALSNGVAASFDLPFMQDYLDHPSAESHDRGYDDRSSFSLTVNHRDTYTGITDEDRSLTIRSLAEAAANPDGMDFPGTFRSPGHVHLLRAAPELLDQREGHTELGIRIADEAGQPPAVVVCEMLDDDNGGALSTDDARAYAEAHDIPFVEGRALIEHLD
jgi:3,4-dihydroxy 2-butanone 4-phosphate synthase